MSDRRKELLNRLGIWAFDRAQKLFLKKDVRISERRGERLGMLYYRLDKKHRERAHANLELAFPEWTSEERHRVAIESFRHYGRIGGDFFRSPLRTNQEVLDSAEVEGWENFYAAEAKERGVLVITAHLGNFERFAQFCHATGRNITVVARDANQPGIQERIMAIRNKTGIEFISRGDAARPMLVKLKRKELVGLLPDQNSTECFVPFFGQPAGTVLGPAVIHQRTGAPILPAFCIRTGPGKYRISIHPPIDLENTEENAEAIMAEVNAAIEREIRRAPEQYLWMHDRWKSARRRGMLGQLQ